MTIKVDMSELAAVAKDATCARDFDLCTERLIISSKGSDMTVQVSKSSEDEKVETILHFIRRVSRCFNGITSAPTAWKDWGKALAEIQGTEECGSALEIGVSQVHMPAVLHNCV